MKHSVVVITDNPAHAHRLRTLLDEAEDLELADLVLDSANALDAVSRLDCQILLVDESVGPVPAIEVIREVCSRIPYAAALLLSPSPNPAVLEAVVDSGGRGVVGLDEPFEETSRRLLAAGQWSLKVRGIKAELGGLAGSRCFVLSLIGAKGGVGTTSLAVHAARLVRQQRLRVALVDLDTTKSDLASLTAISARRDISDLAVLGDALSVQAVQEVVYADATGLNVLCSPSQPERAEDIDGALVRGLLVTLRQMYDVVIVDAGASVTDVAATAIEMSDEAVIVVTPDMPAVRGARRVLDTCDRLRLRDPAELKVLVNRASSRRQLQPGAIRRLVPAQLLAGTIPSDFPALEEAVNLADPARISSRGWAQGVQRFWTDIASDFLAQAGGLASAPPQPRENRGTAHRRIGRNRSAERRGRRAGLADGVEPATPAVATDPGVVTVEFLALVPLAVLLFVCCLQLIGFAAAEHQATRSAGAAAHAAARGDDPAGAARAEAAPTFDGRIHLESVSTGGGLVRTTVAVDVPSVLPASWLPYSQARADAGAVQEP